MTPSWLSQEAQRQIYQLELFRKETQRENKNDEPYQQWVEGIIESAIAILEQLV
jgi:ATP phosphoribosyltransferase regulatory subunit HisZ